MTAISSGETLELATQPQVILEISDAEAFIGVISRETTKFQFKTPYLGPVTYTDFDIEGLAAGSGRLNPLFTKRRHRPDGYSFEDEREFRAVWSDENTQFAGEDGDINPHPRLKPFFTRPTKTIARFLRRIA